MREREKGRRCAEGEREREKGRRCAEGERKGVSESTEMQRLLQQGESEWSKGFIRTVLFV